MVRSFWGVVAVAVVGVSAGCRGGQVSGATSYACQKTDDCIDGFRCFDGVCAWAADLPVEAPRDAGRAPDAGFWADLRLFLNAKDIASYDGGAQWSDLSGYRNHAVLSGVGVSSRGFLNFANAAIGRIEASTSISFQGPAKQGAVEVVGYFETPTSNGSYVWSSPFVVANPSRRGFMLGGSIDMRYQESVLVSGGTPPDYYGLPISQQPRALQPRHYVLVLNGGSVDLYRDGLWLVGATWRPNEVDQGSIDAMPWVLGAAPAGGTVDTTGANLGLVRHYARALTAAEVAEAYADAKRRLDL